MYKPVASSPWLKSRTSCSQLIGVERFFKALINSFSATNAAESNFMVCISKTVPYNGSGEFLRIAANPHQLSLSSVRHARVFLAAGAVCALGKGRLPGNFL